MDKTDYLRSQVGFGMFKTEIHNKCIHEFYGVCLSVCLCLNVVSQETVKKLL
jgi:hypothetical protein